MDYVYLSTGRFYDKNSNTWIEAYWLTDKNACHKGHLIKDNNNIIWLIYTEKSLDGKSYIYKKQWLGYITSGDYFINYDKKLNHDNNTFTYQEDDNLLLESSSKCVKNNLLTD